MSFTFTSKGLRKPWERRSRSVPSQGSDLKTCVHIGQGLRKNLPGSKNDESERQIDAYLIGACTNLKREHLGSEVLDSIKCGRLSSFKTSKSVSMNREPMAKFSEISPDGLFSLARQFVCGVQSTRVCAAYSPCWIILSLVGALRARSCHDIFSHPHHAHLDCSSSG